MIEILMIAICLVLGASIGIIAWVLLSKNEGAAGEPDHQPSESEQNVDTLIDDDK